MLDRAAILAADDLPRELVEVPEWGGSVHVRTLTGTERDAFEQSVIVAGEKNLGNIRARFAVLTICDENGDRIFGERDAVDLGKKSAAALDRVFAVAQTLNGFSSSDVEDLAGN